MGHLEALPRDETAGDGKGEVSEEAVVQSIVVGPDLVLVITADGRITLCAVTSSGTDDLETFNDVRSAWAMVDRIDLEGHSVSDAKPDEVEPGTALRARRATAIRSPDGLRAA